MVRPKYAKVAPISRWTSPARSTATPSLPRAPATRTTCAAELSESGPGAARRLKRHPVVDDGERQRLPVDGERDRGIADQILDPPAILGAPPDLDVAVLARHQQDLL